MPVPRNEPSTSLRPSGLVDPPVPYGGTVELRVHGVGGATPSALLDDLAPQRVAGDSIAGFYRTSDASGRHVEAYSWGGLTSRSATRVLWLLLTPFLLANLAGWMHGPRPSAERGAGPPASALTRVAVRLTALAVTVNVLLLVGMASLDAIAFQCGGQPRCAGTTWWLAPFTWAPFAEHPLRRVLLGTLVPALVIVVFAVLSTTSRLRYEAVRPPWEGSTPPQRPWASAAALPSGLEHPDFWSGSVSHSRLSRLHLAAALALVALVLVHCVRTTAQGGSGTTWTALWVVLLGVGAAVLAGALVLVARESEPAGAARWLLRAAVALLVVAGVYAWVQPAGPQLPGHLPGMRAAVNVAFAAILLSLVPLLVATVRDELAARRVRPPVPRFRWGAPFVATALAVLMVNVVGLSIVVLVAYALGDVRWCTVGCVAPGGGVGGEAVVFVFSIVQVAVTWMSLGPLAALGLFALVEGVLVLLAVRDPARQAEVRAEYAAQERATPTPPPPRRAWWQSALTDVDGRPVDGWVRRVVLRRRLALATTDLSFVLTALVATAVAVVIVYQVAIWLYDVRTPPGATTLGVLVACAIPVGIVVLMRSSWKRLDQRRLVGILWDVGTFWPRAYHPFAPPSYSERAVPELLRRIWFLHDHGSRVLLTAHSQGTVLAAAALARQAPAGEGPAAQRAVALVTYGSPLRTLYTWGFPAYVTPALLARIASGTGPLGPREWLNAHYPTDPIGGPVLPDGPAAVPVDLALSDPWTSRYVFGEPRPRVTGHSGYWTDPRMWTRVDDVAARLASPARPPPPRLPDQDSVVRGAGDPDQPPLGTEPTAGLPTAG